MARQQRVKTNYPGVFYVEGKSINQSRSEKIFYIRYKIIGKTIEEKIGRQGSLVEVRPNKFKKASAAVSNTIRLNKMQGILLSNQEKRKKESEVKSRWTIEKLWTEYQKQLQDGGNKQDTSRWNIYLRDNFGKKEVRELIKLDTDRLRVNLLKKRSNQTVRHILGLLRRIINFGVDRGLISPLPFKIQMPAVDNQKTEDLSPDELKKLFIVLQKTPYQVAANMMKLALCTGMRRGEIFKLQWEDIDYHRGFIFIRNPKGKKSQKIPLNQNAEQLLRSIKNEQSDYVFPDRWGEARKDISKDLRAIKKEAGLPGNFRPLHGLRHVYATMLASSGKVDMYTLQKLLTHKSPQMTQRYAHHRDEALRRASNEVDSILDNFLVTENIKTNYKK